MNRAKAVKAFFDLLDALEEASDEPKKKPRLRRLPTVPDVQVDEVTQARADRILREKGYRHHG